MNRSHSPFSTPQQPARSMFDFSASTPQPAPQPNSPPTNQVTNGASTDDDWNFSSALPEDTSLPSSTSLTVSDKEVVIQFDVSRRTADEPVLNILAKFSNKSAHPVTEYTFQVAVTRVWQLSRFPLPCLYLSLLHEVSQVTHY